MLQTVGASNFLYFFLFEGFKEPLAILAGQPEGVLGPYETLASSALAGALNMVVTEPLWRACVVAQALAGEDTPGSSPIVRPHAEPSSLDDPPMIPSMSLGATASSSSSSRPMVPSMSERGSKSRGVFYVVYRLWRKEGPRALWRGLASSLWLVTNPVIQFFAYDLLKALARNPSEISSLEAFFMGAVAKALATIFTFPLQVAQSRLRAVKEASPASPDCKRRPELEGMMPCLHALWLEGGVSRLYAGLGTKLLQSVTQAAFLFAFYEKIHRTIRSSSRAPRQLFAIARNLQARHSRKVGELAWHRATLGHARTVGLL